MKSKAIILKNMCKLLFLLLMFSLSLILNYAFAVYQLKPGDTTIEDFEVNKNVLGGTYGTYGAAGGSMYCIENPYSGQKCFKLNFIKNLSKLPENEVTSRVKEQKEKKNFHTNNVTKAPIPSTLKKIDWAIFTINMGPVIDDSTDPVTIEPYDISGYKYLVFWIRGEAGKEEFKICFRDSHATTYDPNLKVSPRIIMTKQWQPVRVDLQKYRHKVDLKNIVQISIAFGRPEGNKPGSIMYIDNFILVRQ